MSSRSPSSLDTDLDASAGVVAIVREAVSLYLRPTGARAIFAVYAVVALLALLSTSLANVAELFAGAFAVVVAYGAFGGRPDVQNSLGVRLLLALVAGIVAGLAIIVGLLLFVLPGLYLLVRLRLVLPAVMLADCGPLEALSRSFDLTDGHGLTVFGVAVVFGLAGLAVGGVVALQTGAFAGGTLQPEALRQTARIASAIQALVIAPVAVAADALMFGLYDRETPA